MHTTIVDPTSHLSRDTWVALFKHLLRVSNAVLSPPAAEVSLGRSLCDTLVHVLFEGWLRACVDCFPTPYLWKSLRELCCRWRHHPNLVEQWNRVTFSLTQRVVMLLYSPKHLAGLSCLPEEDKDFKQVTVECLCMYVLWTPSMH